MAIRGELEGGEGVQHVRLALVHKRFEVFPPESCVGMFGNRTPPHKQPLKSGVWSRHHNSARPKSIKLWSMSTSYYCSLIASNSVTFKETYHKGHFCHCYHYLSHFEVGNNF
jgi:hypothetical protein